MDTLETILNRKSIRKFNEKAVDHSDLLKILECGLNAPSAKNMQNWHFVVIESKQKIKAIADIVKRKQEQLIEDSDDQALVKSFQSKTRFYTFFEQAPVLVLVYASPYTSKTSKLLSGEDLDKYNNTNPGLQNIGAAIENILLGATALGYGTCWMSGPNFAINEIETYVALDKNNYSLISMIPIGHPSDTRHPSPPKKSVDEKVTFI
ncbi:MAG TPA: nitroreductase family protein [Clostridia bacterium]|nr:nitroreductase family protein [Clostridia bacterium]